MMLPGDMGGDAVSGAAIDYLAGRHYWIIDNGVMQIGKVVWEKGRMKWKVIDGEPKAFVERVLKGPIEEPA